jgi:hypothetical protein
MLSQPYLPPSIRILIDAGRSAPSADNSQPWRFCWNGKHFVLTYDSQRASGKTFGPEEHATLLAMGAVKENILQLANFLEVQLDPIEDESRTHTKAYFQFNLKSSHNRTTQSHKHPVFKRHTNRWPYDSEPIPSPIIERLNNISEGQCRALIFADREIIKRIATWVRVASEVRFQSRDVHELLGRSLRFGPEEASHGDGLDLRTLPLPLGGKTFLRLIKDWDRLALLNRVGCYKLLALMEAKAVSVAPTLAAIVGPNGSGNILDAGMLMERIWIYLNSHGVAVHPYYVIPDQLQRLKRGKISANLAAPINGLEREIANLLKRNLDSIHMLFRIGYPSKQPIRSLRLPMEKILEFIQHSVQS